MSRARYDTIVVGAGSAGSVLAARLSEDADRQVLLVEAGPDYPSLATMPDEIRYGRATGAYLATSAHNWQFTGRATPSAPPMPVARGKVVGGTGAINGQIAMRGEPEDFDNWAAAGNAEWSFARVLPVFRRIETDADFDNDVHGQHGPIPIRRDPPSKWSESQAGFYAACRSSGFADCPDHNYPGSTGVGPVPLNNVEGLRMSSAVTYLAPARTRANLELRAGLPVLRLVVEGRRVTGIVVHGPSGEETIDAGEVVLCAGAIGTPHLLLLSGIGPVAGLAAAGVTPRHALAGVGQNLRDHAMITMAWRTRLDNAPAGWIQTSLRYTADVPNDMKIWFAAVRNNLLNSATMPSDSECFGPMLMHPDSVGELTLASADPRAQPRLDYRLLSTGTDLARMRAAVRLVMELAADRGLGSMLGERLKPEAGDLRDDQALDRWLLAEVKTGNHIAGTCRMRPADDPLAVVDQQGRVHGLDGLRIADASIMPQVVRASTNLTTIMIGERIAADIRQAA